MRRAALAWAACLALAGCAPAALEPVERPNVLLYLIDTLRADRLGSYGYDRDTSPAIDALARRGVLFERAYAHDTRTLGSVPTLLTGALPETHGVLSYGSRVRPGVTTLAEALRAEGYDTATFVTNSLGGALSGLDRGFDHYHDGLAGDVPKNEQGSVPYGAVTRWLDAPRDGPFFAYVHTVEPHDPYSPPPPYDSMFLGPGAARVPNRAPARAGAGAAADPATVRGIRALYDGEVRFADDAFARLVAALDERGLLATTIVIVTSDHGEELGDRGGWGHGHGVHEEQLRVPLVVGGPGVLPGRRHASPLGLVDVAPTILELAGVGAPASMDGASFAGALRGESVGPNGQPREILVMTTATPHHGAAIAGRWKCIAAPGRPARLFDLENDPREERDVAAREPGVAGPLCGRLETWMERRSAMPIPAPSPLSGEDEERLRALGYVD